MPTTYTSATAKAPSASRTGVGVVADTRQLSALARDLRKAAPDVWKACRAALRATGQMVANDAKQRASYSSRIPGSIKVRTTAGGNVKIVAGGPQAADAAPLENKGRPGTFRAPLFGDRNHWYEHKARPFLAPALDAHREQVAKEIEDAVVLAVERALKGGL